MAARNLRIIGTTVGRFQAGDVVPAYALAAANPEFLVESGVAQWTTEMPTVSVDAESLAVAAPDATPDLIRAHAKATAENQTLREAVDSTHARCLEFEAKNDALTAELASKVEELATVKSQRDKLAVELEEMKLLADSATDPAK